MAISRSNMRDSASGNDDEKQVAPVYFRESYNLYQAISSLSNREEIIRLHHISNGLVPNFLGFLF